MEILLWLVPAVVATGAAMLVAGWVGRERTISARPEQGVKRARRRERQEEHAQERFARAIQTKHPTSSVSRPRPALPLAADVADEDQRIVVRPVGESAATQTAADTPAAPWRPTVDEQDEDTRRTA